MGGIGYSIALSLIAITISIGGILLGMGYALDDRKLKELARTELYVAIINGVILGTLIAVFSGNGIVAVALSGITNNVSQGYSCPPQLAYNSALCFSYNYVAGTGGVTIHGSSYPTVFDSIITLLVPLSASYSTFSILNSMSFSLGLISFGLSGSMKPLLTGLGYAIDALTLALTSVEVQGVILTFIAATAMSVLMPVAIALRCLYFTRRLGSALLAITIGLFAILPMTYVLDATIVNSYSLAFSPTNVSSLTSSAVKVQSSIINEASAYQSKSVTAPGAFSYMASLASGFLNGIQPFLQGLANFVAITIVQAFLMPTFSLILTVISIRELARILGSEVYFGRFNIV